MTDGRHLRLCLRDGRGKPGPHKPPSSVLGHDPMGKDLGSNFPGQGRRCLKTLKWRRAGEKDYISFSFRNLHSFLSDGLLNWKVDSPSLPDPKWKQRPCFPPPPHSHCREEMPAWRLLSQPGGMVKLNQGLSFSFTFCMCTHTHTHSCLLSPLQGFCKMPLSRWTILLALFI